MNFLKFLSISMISMFVRKAVAEDLSNIMRIYHIAQEFMIETGNPDQWGHEYPGRNLIKEDIDNEVCHLICDMDGAHGVFALFSGDEPTYQYIENGEWLNDNQYVTIHRMASDGKLGGIFNCAVSYCRGLSEDIRIDTHENNLVMQGLIEKTDFKSVEQYMWPTGLQE